MRPAQIGLLITAPLIVGVAILLHRQGALGAIGVIVVIIATAVASAVLFLSH